jgi:hypothetical protein
MCLETCKTGVLRSSPQLVCVKHFEHCCPHVLVAGCRGLRGWPFFIRDDKRAKGSIELLCLRIGTQTQMTTSCYFYPKKQELRRI